MTTNTESIDPITLASMEMRQRQHARDMKRQELAESLSSFINGASHDEINELAADLAKDHRSLVQRKFSFFLSFVKVLASADATDNYDARNEYSVKTSVKIMNILNGSSGVPNV